MKSLKPQTKAGKWLLGLVAIFFVVILILITSVFLWQKYYQDKIYPGVRIGSLNLSHKTIEEAEQLITQKTNYIKDEGITFSFKTNSINLIPTISSFSAGFAYPVIEFEETITAQKAFSYGRDNSYFTNLFKQLKAFIYSYQIDLQTELKEEEIKKILEENFKDNQTPARNAQLETSEQNQSIKFNITPEKQGEIIDYEKAIKNLKNNLKSINLSTIELEIKSEKPQIYQKDCQGMEEKAEQLLTKAPITLLIPIENQSNASKEWIINESQLAPWLQLQKKDNYITIGLNQEEVSNFLKEVIAPQVNQEPIEAKFEIDDGKVIEFKDSQDGIKLDILTSFQEMEKEITSTVFSTSTQIKLITEAVKSKITAENVNDLGIKEVIATGESDFSGSPANRIHNIRTGAESLKGELIKPDEEFSLVKALGKINAESGYKPELVIKGNKTIPEYGGGLCQVSTTLFRTALNSGLEITERRNHSYRVSYYEPAGTDAAIYSPHPDLRFINDTESYILIQYRLEGSKLYFDFWGTDDGRTASTTQPVIYNLVNPGPTRIIETTDLAPGQKKCTERAHTGADTYFDYQVTYADGETRERRFYSHYVPWREVCLVGIAENKTDDLEENQDENQEESLEETIKETPVEEEFNEEEKTE